MILFKHNLGKYALLLMVQTEVWIRAETQTRNILYTMVGGMCDEGHIDMRYRDTLYPPMLLVVSKNSESTCGTLDKHYLDAEGCSCVGFPV